MPKSRKAKNRDTGLSVELEPLLPPSAERTESKRTESKNEIHSVVHAVDFASHVKREVIAGGDVGATITGFGVAAPFAFAGACLTLDEEDFLDPAPEPRSIDPAKQSLFSMVLTTHMITTPAWGFLCTFPDSPSSESGIELCSTGSATTGAIPGAVTSSLAALLASPCTFFCQSKCSAEAARSSLKDKVTNLALASSGPRKINVVPPQDQNMDNESLEASAQSHQHRL